MTEHKSEKTKALMCVQHIHSDSFHPGRWTIDYVKRLTLWPRVNAVLSLELLSRLSDEQALQFGRYGERPVQSTQHTHFFLSMGCQCVIQRVRGKRWKSKARKCDYMYENVGNFLKKCVQAVN